MSKKLKENSSRSNSKVPLLRQTYTQSQTSIFTANGSHYFRPFCGSDHFLSVHLVIWWSLISRTLVNMYSRNEKKTLLLQDMDVLVVSAIMTKCKTNILDLYLSWSQNDSIFSVHLTQSINRLQQFLLESDFSWMKLTYTCHLNSISNNHSNWLSYTDTMVKVSHW